jgi:uncharacterized membrane protein YbhN (UPF0104 family)
MSSLVVLAIGTGAVDGLIALPFATGLSDEVRITTAVALGAVAVLTGLFFLLPLERLPLGEGWVSQRLRDVVTGWHQIKGDRRTLLVLCATAAATPLLLGLRFWVCFSALSMPVHAAESMLLAAAILVSMPVNVTPGGIGPRELIGSAIGAAAGLGFAHVLAAVTIDRVISMLFSLVAGGSSLWWMRRRGMV